MVPEEPLEEEEEKPSRSPKKKALPTPTQKKTLSAEETEPVAFVPLVGKAEWEAPIPELEGMPKRVGDRTPAQQEAAAKRKPLVSGRIRRMGEYSRALRLLEDGKVNHCCPFCGEWVHDQEALERVRPYTDYRREKPERGTKPTTYQKRIEE